MSGQPGTTLGIAIGHAAQGDTDQPGTKQASDKPAGDSKLGWSEEAEEDQRLHLLGEQECGASSGWRVRDGDRQLHKCHTSPAKISRGTQQRSGLETGSLERRTCRTRLERLGEAWRPWTPAVCGVISPRGPTLIPYLCPYSCQGGKGNPEGTVPWNCLGEGSMGRRKEGEHGGNGLLAVQMQCSFPSRIQSFLLWSFKSRECFCWALAGIFPWPLTEGPF